MENTCIIMFLFFSRQHRRGYDADVVPAATRSIQRQSDDLRYDHIVAGWSRLLCVGARLSSRDYVSTNVFIQF